MSTDTVSTAQAAHILGVTEQTVRNRIAADELHGVIMVGGCWRIPVNSLRAEPLLSTADDSKTSAPPPYLQRLINRLDAFDTGMVPCADAAEIAGIGVKAMRNGLRSGRIPGGRLVGGSWLVTVADLGAWLGVQRVA